MTNQLFMMLFSSLQVAFLLMVYYQVSKVHVVITDIVIFCIGGILGSLILGRFLFMLMLLIFYWIGIKGGLVHKKSLAFFYGIYSISFFSLIGNLFTSINEQFFNNNSIINTTVVFVPVLLNYLILQVAHPDFEFLRENYAHITRRFLLIINVFLFILCGLQYGSYYWESHVGSLGTLRYVLTASFIILELFIIFYLNMKLRILQKTQLEQLREEELQELSQHTQQVENLYNKIRGIRHDYINVMLSLGEGIKEQNLSKVKETYDSVFKSLGASLQDNRYDLTRLSNVKIAAIKGLLSAKIIEAQEKHVKTTVEVYKPIINCYIDLLDYVRIMSIFLDNAIEASLTTDNPNVSIALINNETKKEQILIVQNNSADKEIDKRKIFKRGFSSKGTNRGLGLSIVRDLLLKYPNLSLETQFKNHYFTQTLTLKEAV